MVPAEPREGSELTRRLTSEEWQQLSSHHSEDCVAYAREALEGDGLVELAPETLGSISSCSDRAANMLLDKLDSMGAVEKETRTHCLTCKWRLTPEEAARDTCVNCEADIVVKADSLRTKVIYWRRSNLARSVPWVLVLHGMNTLGAWQEQLSWLVATTYGRSVPVLIHKYGRVRPGVLFRSRHQRLAAGLMERILEAAGEREQNRLGPRPDVIAHSFGTLLLARALESTHDLKIGRLILVGSILPPTFDWSHLQNRGQVDQVLNVCGSRDRWVPLAEYIIPDSGPSGSRGFARGSPAIQRRAEGVGHTDFFKLPNLRDLFITAWRPFLQHPSDRLHELNSSDLPVKWRPSNWLLRARLFRWLVLLVAGVVLALSATALALGIRDIWRFAAQL